MEGSGVNTYRMVNADGDTVLVKYHFHPRCGVACLTADEAAKVPGAGPGFRLEGPVRRDRAW